jgi:hypothetical protein
MPEPKSLDSGYGSASRKISIGVPGVDDSDFFDGRLYDL